MRAIPDGPPQAAATIDAADGRRLLHWHSALGGELTWEPIWIELLNLFVLARARVRASERPGVLLWCRPETPLVAATRTIDNRVAPLGLHVEMDAIQRGQCRSRSPCPCTPSAQNTSSCAAKADEVRRRAELALCTLLAKIRGPAAARAPPHAAAANLVVLGPVFGAHARAPQYTHAQALCPAPATSPDSAL